MFIIYRVIEIINPLTAIVLYRGHKNNCLQRRYIVLPNDCDGVECRKTSFILRRGSQKVKLNTIQSVM
jgi:hypothetical protein